jgi:hypothetical protein
MKILIIKKSGQITHGPTSFQTQEELEAHLARHEAMQTYGKPDIYETTNDLIVPEVRGEVQVLQTPATFNEFGEELTPATYFIDPDGIISPAVYEWRQHLVSVKEYTVEIVDITSEVEAAAVQSAKIEAGRLAREACQKVLDLIAGYNLDRELSLSQISQLQTLMAAPEAALRAGRPTLAKQYITAVSPDGVLVTAAMKQDALSLLSNY